MDPHVVVVAKRLALHVDRLERQGGGVQRVDGSVRRGGSMCRPTNKPRALGDQPVGCPAHAELAVVLVAGGVDHHRQIDVVESPQAQELRLAAQELELACLRLLEPPFEVDVLLGRDREEDDVARQITHRVCFDQRLRHADQVGELGVVPARVDDPGRRVGARMLGYRQSVQLTEDAHGRAGPPPFNRAFTPVSANPAWGARPRPRSRSATSVAVRSSRKPSSAWSKTSSPKRVSSSRARSSTPASAAFSSSRRSCT